MRDLQAGSFSIASFYFRRIRRIFPAYFAIVVVVLVTGIAIYPWPRLIPLAQTALFSTLFSTNIYFWMDMGYFQPNAHGNPLLHLWSLGVEEQFYLIIPIALLVLWKIRRTLLVPALLVGFIASLAL
jgi:peptidoglycan/LPS O-acetylase OafA/YrhL